MANIHYLNPLDKYLKTLTMRFNLNDGFFFSGSSTLATRMYEAFDKEPTRDAVQHVISDFEKEKGADIDFEQILSKRIPHNLLIPFQENVVTIFEYGEKYRIDYERLLVEDLVDKWQEVYHGDYNMFKNIGREIADYSRIYSHFAKSLEHAYWHTLAQDKELDLKAQDELIESLKSVNVFQMKDYLTYRQENDERIEDKLQQTANDVTAFTHTDEGYPYEYYSPSAGRRVVLRVF